jgi:cytochrome c biogenesis protein
MHRKETPADPLFKDKLWETFASVRLTIFLLLTLAATSIIGTFIPQNEDPAAYYQIYGKFLYRFFSLLGLFDMYHSWWFRFLVLLLTVNVIVCSLKRLTATWRTLFVKNSSFNPARFRNLRQKQEFLDSRPAVRLKPGYESVVARSFHYHRTEDTDKGFVIFAEKGRWTRLGVYMVHLSVIVLLIGSLIGSIFGFEGYVNIAEGQSAERIRLRNSNAMLALDFEIRCDDFEVSFYDSGAPKEFRSSLTILRNGRPVEKKDILVNDPLRYEGVNIFQSSYGSAAPSEVILSFTSQATGMIYSKKAAVGKRIIIPEGLGTFEIKAFRDSADFKGHNIGEAFIGILTPVDAEPVEVLLPLRYPSFDKMRKGNVVVSVAGFVPRYFTGLQVTRDPGLWVVYAGFIWMIIGCFITFFMAHQQVCVEVVEENNKSRISVAGISNKNKLGMPRKIAAIAHRLAGRTKEDL